MPRSKEIRAIAVPGAGAMFALRAIGVVILARWLSSMAQMGFGLFASVTSMASSPWACLNAVFIFLLIVLPGARAKVERPFHPLPQWLRQALRVLAFVGFLFAVWAVGSFVLAEGVRRALEGIVASNGWLVAAPALYLAVVWICRPRALWRTNPAARRFAIGRYAVSIDPVTRTTVVWVERRKLGQYDARELSVRWRDAGASATPATPSAAVSIDANGQALASPAIYAAPPVTRARFARRPKIELLWDSPAAAGHNRQTVFRTTLASVGDRAAAQALDASLKQF